MIPHAPLVKLSGVSKSFHSHNGTNKVLEEVELEIYPGQKASLVGASGSGKSTLLSLITGLLRPDTGTITFDGVSINALGDDEQSKIRACGIGIALQAENLIPFLTARENVELALSFAGEKVGSKQTVGLLERMGVAHLASYYPRQISGGETQRVALTVALANNPKLLIADEMVAQLDFKTASLVVKDIFGRDMAVLFVTHNQTLAASAERRFCVRNKRIVTL